MYYLCSALATAGSMCDAVSDHLEQASQVLNPVCREVVVVEGGVCGLIPVHEAGPTPFIWHMD